MKKSTHIATMVTAVCTVGILVLTVILVALAFDATADQKQDAAVAEDNTETG